MLVELHVVDLGIVADLTWCSAAGLTAITGETGAGKTLIVEALELLVGGRADAALVRDGATEARVEGRFVHPDDRRRRPCSRASCPATVAAAPTSTAGSPPPASSPRSARALVDLHGQHAHQSLLDPAVQRGALDRYAGAAALDARARVPRRTSGGARARRRARGPRW